MDGHHFDSYVQMDCFLGKGFHPSPGREFDKFDPAYDAKNQEEESAHCLWYAVNIHSLGKPKA